MLDFAHSASSTTLSRTDPYTKTISAQQFLGLLIPEPHSIAIYSKLGKNLQPVFIPRI
jgi:hypothetical protein